MNTNHFSLTVATDLQALILVLQWFGQFKDACKDEGSWLQCEIALVEIFTNAVRHAHHHLGIETPIEIQVVLNTQSIELQVWDFGKPFNLTDYLKTLPDRIDTSSESGRGLKIIKEVADSFAYTRHNDRNCFSMIRYFQPHE